MNPKELVAAFFEEGYTNRNFGAIMEYLAEDYVDHSPAGARSNADAVGILKIVAGQYSEMQAQMLDIFAEGGMVATRVRFQGIREGTRICFKALENFQVENGKIVESWGYWPDWDIERQLLG